MLSINSCFGGTEGQRSWETRCIERVWNGVYFLCFLMWSSAHIEFSVCWFLFAPTPFLALLPSFYHQVCSCCIISLVCSLNSRLLLLSVLILYRLFCGRICELESFLLISQIYSSSLTEVTVFSYVRVFMWQCCRARVNVCIPLFYVFLQSEPVLNLYSRHSLGGFWFLNHAFYF